MLMHEKPCLIPIMAHSVDLDEIDPHCAKQRATEIILTRIPRIECVACRAKRVKSDTKAQANILQGTSGRGDQA